ncbi:hypothetical protein AB0J43_00275 [Nonomuraea fuscirosea]
MPYALPGPPITADSLYEEMADVVDEVLPLLNRYQAASGETERTAVAHKIVLLLVRSPEDYAGYCLAIIGAHGEVIGDDGEPLHYADGHEAWERSEALAKSAPDDGPYTVRVRDELCHIAACVTCGATSTLHRPTQEDADQAAAATWIRTEDGLRCVSCLGMAHETATPSV